MHCGRSYAGELAAAERPVLCLVLAGALNTMYTLVVVTHSM